MDGPQHWHSMRSESGRSLLHPRRGTASSGERVGGGLEGALVISDSGSESVNRHVDDELEETHLECVLAQIDVTYSNSMIEAF